MEVIHVKLAKEYVMGNYPNDPLLKHIVTVLLDQLPKTDAVEVVRCGECVKRQTSAFDGLHFCALCNCKCNDPEWYCPEGERSSDG